MSKEQLFSKSKNTSIPKFLLSKHILWWSPFMAGSVQALLSDSEKELFVNVLARD